MYRIWCLRSVAHPVGDRPIYSIRKPSLVSAFWVAGRALPRVDWRSRLAWLIWSNSDGIVLEANLEGLIFSVVIVKDDFGTVGGIAHQHVAKILVGLNIIGGSVARLGIRLAAKRRGLQSLASRIVNIRDVSLLVVGRVGNDNVNVVSVMRNVLVGYNLLVGRVARLLWACNVLEVLVLAPVSLK